MAKKVLTPEEVKAKMDKKSAKRKLFFGTFTKALAFFLAIAICFSLAAIAFAPVTTSSVAGNGTTQNGGETVDNGDDDVVDWGDSDSIDNSGSVDNSAGSVDNSGSTDNSGSSANSGSTDNSGSASNSGSAAAQLTAADVAKAYNEATAKAANASYHWKRSGNFTKDIDLGSSIGTNMVNSIIKGIDENATLNSVVGGFLGIGNNEADVTNGAAPEGMNEKYLISAATITANDIQTYKVNGNKYMIQIKNTNTPTADSPMGRAMNDYITVEEANAGIASFTSAISVKDSSTADYTSIAIIATIENGQLTNLTYSYNFSASLDLSIGFTGTGAAKISAEYSNFKY